MIGKSKPNVIRVFEKLSYGISVCYFYVKSYSHYLKFSVHIALVNQRNEKYLVYNS